MKVNLDDPNLTAYALGELSPDDHAEMAEAIADSPEAQNYVAETQQFARLLRAEYDADRQQPADADKQHRLSKVVWTEEQRRSSSRYQWGSLAAAVAMFAVIAAVAITTIQRESGKLTTNRKPSVERQNLPSAPVEAIPEPTVEMDIAQAPPAAEPRPPATKPEFVEEQPNVSGCVGTTGKSPKLAGLNPSAPMP